jgi:hypothetical protein
MYKKRGRTRPHKPPQPVHDVNHQRDGCQHGPIITSFEEAITAKTMYQTGIDKVRQHNADDADTEQQPVSRFRDMVIGDVGERRS